jgi:hypothetical protein
VPVTFTGLRSYRAPLLEQKTPDGWKPVDQSVAGRDFWQCDFNPADRTWEITFTLQPDTAFKHPLAMIEGAEWREYRFHLTSDRKESSPQ